MNVFKCFMTVFIIVISGVLFSCSSEDESNYDENEFSKSGMTAKKEDVPPVDDPFNPVNGNGGPVGGTSHWVCKTCSTINSVYGGFCVWCGSENPKPSSGASGNPPGGNPEEPPLPPSSNESGVTLWHKSSSAQIYYNEMINSVKYKTDSKYAAGASFAWDQLTSRIKSYDSGEGRSNMCQLFINQYVINSTDLSYKEGLIAGVDAILKAHNTLFPAYSITVTINGVFYPDLILI